MEATWSKHFTQAGSPRATSEDHVQAAFGHLQAQRLYNLCAQHRSPFSSEPSCGGKTKAVEFGDAPVVTPLGSVFSALTYQLTPGREIVAEIVLT